MYLKSDVKLWKSIWYLWFLTTILCVTSHRRELLCAWTHSDYNHTHKNHTALDTLALKERYGRQAVESRHNCSSSLQHIFPLKVIFSRILLYWFYFCFVSLYYVTVVFRLCIQIYISSNHIKIKQFLKFTCIYSWLHIESTVDNMDLKSPTLTILIIQYPQTLSSRKILSVSVFPQFSHTSATLVPDMPPAVLTRSDLLYPTLVGWLSYLSHRYSVCLNEGICSEHLALHSLWHATHQSSVWYMVWQQLG